MIGKRSYLLKAGDYRNLFVDFSTEDPIPVLWSDPKGQQTADPDADPDPSQGRQVFGVWVNGMFFGQFLRSSEEAGDGHFFSCWINFVNDKELLIAYWHPSRNGTAAGGKSWKNTPILIRGELDQTATPEPKKPTGYDWNVKFDESLKFDQSVRPQPSCPVPAMEGLWKINLNKLNWMMISGNQLFIGHDTDIVRINGDWLSSGRDYFVGGFCFDETLYAILLHSKAQDALDIYFWDVRNNNSKPYIQNEIKRGGKDHHLLGIDFPVLGIDRCIAVTYKP